jgi:FlaA1/EpsC-like NDP-sugar epimerase
MSEETLRIIILTVMGMTALSTLSFPICFARYNWRKTPIGRALMVKSSSTASAVTVTFLLALIRPPLEVRLIVYVLCFGVIAVSSLRLTWTMLRINNADRVIAPKKEEVKK